MRGVPLRIEIGPRDVANQSVMVARRDIPGREGKFRSRWRSLPPHKPALLESVQAAIYARALAFRDSHIVDVTTFGELKEAVETGFARSVVGRWDRR